jgi:4-hydroxybenzoate polyprenyltransferase
MFKNVKISYHSFLQSVNKLGFLIRFDQWWAHKILPAISIFFLFRLVKSTPISIDDWKCFFLLTLALFLSATYTSISNDLSDIDTDRLAGKFNRLNDFSRKKSTLILLIILILGASVLFLLEGLLLKFTFVAIWLDWSLYSFKPFRGKNRGVWGVLLDSMGSHVLPALLAIEFAVPSVPSISNNSLPVLFCLFWSFCWGLRGILWHQLYDYYHDKASLVRTLPVIIGFEHTVSLVLWIVFPLEVAFYILLLATVNPVIIVPFVIYTMYELIGHFSGKIRQTVVEPTLSNRVFLNYYYIFIAPLSMLCSTSTPNFVFTIVFLGLFAHKYWFFIKLTIRDWTKHLDN